MTSANFSRRAGRVRAVERGCQKKSELTFVTLRSMILFGFPFRTDWKEKSPERLRTFRAWGPSRWCLHGTDVNAVHSTCRS